MRRSIIILIFLFAYNILFKTYLIFQGEAVTYILNPLAWIVLTISSYFLLHNYHRKKTGKNIDIFPIVIVLSLIYIILYYAFGIVLGYTNNPYATDVSGIIINLFSICLIVGLKEYIRYLLVNINLRRYKKTYYSLLFIVFFITEINFLNIIDVNDVLNLWAKELIIPFLYTLLMMYLAYVGNYRTPIIARIILLLPSIILNVVPNYKWYVIMLFNILYCLAVYLGTQYVIKRHQRELPTRLVDAMNIRGWIITAIISFLLIVFFAGFLSTKPVVILTASMKPLINPGDMVIIKKCNVDDIKTGNIIAYKMDNHTIVHRVIALFYKFDKTLMITKGDANKRQDRNFVTDEQLIGCLEYNIPYIGYPAYFIRNSITSPEDVNIEQGG